MEMNRLEEVVLSQEELAARQSRIAEIQSLLGSTAADTDEHRALASELARLETEVGMSELLTAQPNEAA